jgi:hypothetical protein
MNKFLAALIASAFLLGGTAMADQAKSNTVAQAMATAKPAAMKKPAAKKPAAKKPAAKKPAAMKPAPKKSGM